MTFKPLAIFGGTFDPVHLGHLQLAFEISQKFDIDEVRFIPCKIPVHKNTLSANADDRLAMLHLAIENEKKFVIDEREIHRDEPSYMVPTLKSLQQDFPDRSLCLIVGLDVLVGLKDWYQAEELANLCHLIAIPRLEYDSQDKKNSIDFVMSHWNSVEDFSELPKQKSGCLFIAKTSILEISATKIRELISQGIYPQYLLPEKVLQYIKKKKLYIPS